MNDTKYIGLWMFIKLRPPRQFWTTGKLVMESVLETKAATILQFVGGLRGRSKRRLQECGDTSGYLCGTLPCFLPGFAGQREWSLRWRVSRWRVRWRPSL
jgi:hypothetical protein